MSACTFDGHADFFGLGIRVAFYLQWFGVTLASLLVPTAHRDHRVEDPVKNEIVHLEWSNMIFSLAEFLALVIVLSIDQYSLQPVEIYVTLLLAFGFTLLSLPNYIYRVIILCTPYADPTRWPITRWGPIQRISQFLFVLAVACFNLWFWFTKVPQLNDYPCNLYGFLFAELALNSKTLQTTNLMLYFTILFSCIGILAVRLLQINVINYNGEPVPTSQKQRLQNVSAFLSLIPAALLVAAIELTIQWNNILHTNTLASAGQTIPLAIAAGLVLRVLYVWRFVDPDPSNQMHYYREPEHRRVMVIERYGYRPEDASMELPLGVEDLGAWGSHGSGSGSTGSGSGGSPRSRMTMMQEQQQRSVLSGSAEQG